MGIGPYMIWSIEEKSQRHHFQEFGVGFYKGETLNGTCMYGISMNMLKCSTIPTDGHRDLHNMITHFAAWSNPSH